MLLAQLILFGLLAQNERSLFVGGSEALGRGDLNAARQSFEQILKSNPRHLPALANLGVVYSQTGEFQRAAEIYRRAIQLAPTDPRLRLNLGLAYFKQDRYRDALQQFDWLLQNGHADNRNRELLATCQIALGNAAGGLKSLEGLPPSASVLFQKGLAHLRLGRQEEAQAAFGNMLEAAVSREQAHFLLGRAHYEAGAFEEAAREFQQAAGVAGAERELGKTLISLRKNDEAEAALRKAAAKDAHDIEAEYFLAGVLLQASRPEEALPHLRRVVARRPDFWGAHYYLGRTLLQKGDADGAIQHLEEAARQQPGEGPVHYQLARAYSAAGRFEDAKRSRARFAELRQAGHGEEGDLLRRGKLPGESP